MSIHDIRRISALADERPIDEAEALVLARAETADEIDALFDGADRLRRKYKGNKVSTCAIVNAKSGRCGEDCKFCAQSVHFETGVKTYDFIGKERILSAAERAAENGAREFSIVIAGRKMRKPEMREAFDILPEIKNRTGMSTCGSLGAMEEDELRELRDNGLNKFHHNLKRPVAIIRRSHRRATTTPIAVRSKRRNAWVCSYAAAAFSAWVRAGSNASNCSPTCARSGWIRCRSIFSIRFRARRWATRRRSRPTRRSRSSRWRAT
ncbi:MAG: radical SAM protein [Deltaproteobacteria bacterium]|nr:radical SAM protein [Deltaproteobacteria bacterium]